ncbi:MAG: hypothetical protein IKN69_00640 [Bacilli bacterium]|nr:hypothetical protein [Bacilli bacterium]
MKFEKQMKKHIDQVFEENVPNPYPTPIKEKRFPSWFKYVIPAGAVLAVASVATAIIVPNAIGNALGPIGSGNGSSSEPPSTSIPFSGTDCTEMTNFVFAPKNDRMIPTFDRKIVSRTGLKSFEKLTPYFKDPHNKNFVLSPASHLLCASSLIAVSDGFDLDAFGLEDAGEDTKALLEQWNCSYSTKNANTGEVYDWTRFDSAVLHQQVGGTFAFDPAKCQAVSDKYIATSAANHANYVDQATQYFQQAINLSVPVPKVQMNGDGVLTYGALKMKDLAMTTYTTEKRTFHAESGNTEIDYACIGKSDAGVSVLYYEGSNYQTFSFRNATTDLMIVLPNEGVSLEDVSLEEAYTEIAVKAAKYRSIYGYVPYFHNSSDSIDLSDSFIKYMSGNELLWSKLLRRGGVPAHDLSFYVLQSSDFQFCDKGIFGESVTVAGGSSGAMPSRTPLLVDVNRPFYAICLQDKFPLFINKVNNPGQSTSIKQ